MRRPASSRRLTAPLIAVLLASLLPAALALDLQGHRGARGLAPENTLPAFERALSIGVTTLELDIGVTADGVVVIAHDTALNPAITRDAQGRWLSGPGPTLRSLRLAELQTYDVGRIDPATPYARSFAEQQPRDGTRIPTLKALFDRVRALGADQVRFNIETKIQPSRPEETASPEVMVDALLAVIDAAGMSRRVTIQSFDWRTLQRVQRVAPGIPTVYLSLQSASTDTIRDGSWTAGFTLAQHGSVPRMVKAAGGAVWSPNAGALTQAAVQEARGLGLQVVPWTVNAPADMERLIDWGVDGIITDHPDRLRAVMQRRGLALPPAVAVP